jgi:phage/plasmid-like protein (TIGR03299 family)
LTDLWTRHPAGPETDWHARSKIPGRFAVRRTDTFDTLGVVGDKYRPLQNREVADFTDLLVDTRASSLVGMGVTGEGGTLPGSRVYSVVKLDETIRPGGIPDEAVDVFLLVWNSFDGTTAFTASIVPYRLACVNGLRYAMKDQVMTWKVQHTSHLQERVVMARDSIQRAVGFTETLRIDMEDLLRIDVTTHDAMEILDQVFPIPDPRYDEDGAMENDRARTNALDRQINVLDLFRSGDDLANIRGTGWGLVNAVAEWSEWGRRTRTDAMSRLINGRETVGAVVRARESVRQLTN